MKAAACAWRSSALPIRRMLGTVFASGWLLKSTKITGTPAASSWRTASLPGAGPWPPDRARMAKSGRKDKAFSTLKLSAEVAPTRGTCSACGKTLR